MCLTVTKAGIKKLAKLQASGKEFVYGYALKEKDEDGNIKSFCQSYYAMQKGINYATRQSGKITLKPRKPIIREGTDVHLGFHLSLSTKFDVFKDGFNQSFYMSGEPVIIKVKVAVKDIIAMGQHASGWENFDTDVKDGDAFVARKMEWAGKILRKSKVRAN